MINDAVESKRQEWNIPADKTIRVNRIHVYVDFSKFCGEGALGNIEQIKQSVYHKTSFVNTHRRTEMFRSPPINDLLWFYNASLAADMEQENICDDLSKEDMKVYERFFYKQVFDGQDAIAIIPFQTSGFVRPSMYYTY